MGLINMGTQIFNALAIELRNEINLNVSRESWKNICHVIFSIFPRIFQ
jgi:hypothetical protein